MTRFWIYCKEAGLSHIHPGTQAKNLDLILDSSFSLISYIQSITKSLWFYLQNIHQSHYFCPSSLPPQPS